MSNQMNLPLSPSATSSPALEDGRSPSDSLGGPTTAPSGPAPALANLSARQAKALGLLTSGTYGQHGFTSSSSIALAWSLANRLKQRLSIDGSILFKLTWKALVTPLGRSYFLLRASGHRTSDRGCGSWPTPNIPNGGRSVSIQKMSTTGRTLDGRRHTVSLEHVARFATWASPSTRDFKSNEGSPEFYAKRQGQTRGKPLSEQAHQLAGWVSPTARDHSRGSEPPRPWDTGVPLSQQAALSMAPWSTLASWVMPRVSDAKDGNLCRSRPRGVSMPEQAQLAALSGPPVIGYPVATEKPGQLNPAFSRWLQGYPKEWCEAAILAWRSMPTIRRKRE